MAVIHMPLPVKLFTGILTSTPDMIPGAERQQAEAAKLEGIIRAADALDCRLVRSFFYWQPPPEQAGALAVRPDLLAQAIELFLPLADS